MATVTGVASTSYNSEHLWKVSLRDGSNSPSQDLERSDELQNYEVLQEKRTSENEGSIREIVYGNEQLHSSSSTSYNHLGSLNYVEAEEGSNFRPNDTPSENVILCIFVRHNKLGAAAYNGATFQLHVLESAFDCAPNFFVLQEVFRQVHPGTVVCCSRMPMSVRITLNKLIEDINKSREESVLIQKYTPKIFNYIPCKNRVLLMGLGGPLSELEEDERDSYILSTLNLSDEHMVIAIGVLLLFLSSELPKIRFSHRGVKVHGIEFIRLENLTWIDEDTYTNLQIFDPINHPSSFKWATRESKEGLCLYRILERFCSKLGSSHLRIFMTQPSKNIELLKRRHEVIAFCIDQKNSSTVKLIKMHLSNISSLSILVASMSCPYVRGEHWKNIYRNIYYAVLTAEICKAKSEGILIFGKIGNMLSQELYAMAHHINRVIDFGAMEKNEMFVVKTGVCKKLDEAKDVYANLVPALNKITIYEFDTVPEFVEKLHIMYIPEILFVLAVPFWKDSLSEEELQLPNLEFKFSACNVAYYKSKRCRELDEVFGDPQVDIMREESSIMKGLSQYITKNIHHLVTLIKELTDLDCLFALATLAKEQNYIPPTLSKENVVKLTNCRHPLMEFSMNNFIPNDYDSTLDSGPVKIIYGPNSSGKTVFLKQVALIMYMAHIGSYVPAEKATIGVVQQIVTCIPSSESIALRTSSFMTNLFQIATAIYNSTPSLIVIDEFGRGTSEINAVPILVSCIEYMMAKKEKCPHVIVSTHFYSVCYFFSPSSMLSIYMMDLIFDENQVIYLYKLTSNAKQHSFILENVKELGASSKIKNSALRVLKALQTGEGIYPFSNARIRRSLLFESFCKRFATLDLEKEGYLERLRTKLQNTYRMCKLK